MFSIHLGVEIVKNRECIGKTRGVEFHLLEKRYSIIHWKSNLRNLQFKLS